MNIDSSYNSLIKKLDEFIRKYYKNQLIKGAIYASGSIVLFYLALAVLEYFARFNSVIRTVLFYSFITSVLYILTRYVAIPLSKLYKLGKVISYDEAAMIIGIHFGQVQDKLLNVLQLEKQRTSNTENPILIAGIDQKITELKPIPFTSAINLKENKKHLKYAIFPLASLILILFTAPSLIKDGTNRLVHHTKYFEPPAPFSFKLSNESLNGIEHEDFLLALELQGKEIPFEVYLQTDEGEFKMERKSTLRFEYILKNLQKNTSFRFFADDIHSKEYKLNVLPKPVLLDFNIKLDYPKYLNKSSESLKNIGDLIIPEGTSVNWKFRTLNTDKLSFSFRDTLINLNRTSSNSFVYSRKVRSNTLYNISTSNKHLKNRDSISYQINVIKDAYPQINFETKRDSFSNNRLFFSGTAKDDYGLTELTFNYRVKNGKIDEGFKSEPISLNKGQNFEQFFYDWNLSELQLELGNEVDYYFEVWDNDGVNGRKSVKTPINVFKTPSASELAKKTSEKNESIKKSLEESIKQAKEIQEDIKKLNKKLVDKKQLNWQEKQQLENLLQKQNQLENSVNEIKKENKRNNRNKSEYSKVDESLLEKQEQLEKLFEEIMTEEMKELFEELEKLLDQLNKDKVQETLEEMELSNKDIEKELDRTLELFKQLEFEQKLDETIEQLNDLKEKQEELSEDTKNKEKSNEELTKEQEKLNKEFDDVKKQLDELQKKNEELEQPNTMEETSEEEKKTSEDQKESLENLQKNKSKKASENQKSAAKNMESLQEKLEQMQSSMQSQSQGEDINKLRAILENLVKLSFDQESVMSELQQTKTNDPRYVQLAQMQKRLQDESKMAEDSILALSKRAPGIEATVNREISAIHMNMGKAIEAMAERQTGLATSRQQFAMTSVNNLALLLNEALQQMQAQMRQQQSQMQGKGSCNKPGGGSPKPSAANMRKMQQQLNKQIEELKKQMEKGKNPGQKDGNGQMGKGGTQGMSKELAKLAAQQEAIRREMQKMMEEMKNNGKNPGGSLDELSNKMEETETDLVNKVISQETLMRQQEILTRLLEHEKAERERGTDEKRESNEAKNENFGNPNEFLEYKRLKEREIELLRTIPAALTPFYKKKVNEYFNSIE